MDSFRAHAALGAAFALAEPQGVCHKSHVISAPDLRLPVRAGSSVRIRLSVAAGTYAAAGRSPARLSSTARSRWLRRAHAQGSTSS
jgi:hypothetical protein